MGTEVQLQGSLNSLKLGLIQSFVLKNQCNNLVEALKVLMEDVKNNLTWYSTQRVFTFNLVTFVKKFLRFVRIHLKVTDRFPPGLGDLRKARSLSNITSLRTGLNTFSSEFQVLLFCSPLVKRLGGVLAELFSGTKLAEAYANDSAAIPGSFKKVVESLKKAPLEDKSFLSFLEEFAGKLQAGASIEAFESPELAHASYKVENILLGMTVNNPTPFSTLVMDQNKPFREGRFGTLFKGTWGGPMSVCIHKISSTKLQTLSSDGRIKLFQTLRAMKTKNNQFVVEVQGVTLHNGTMFVSMEEVSVSLKDLLHGHDEFPPRRFAPTESLAVINAVAGALSFLHTEGLVHGDVRPDNIFFSRKGQEGFVKLGLLSYELNLDELHWSTWTEEALVYQAPEVLGNKKFSSASDIYSLGMVMWEISQLDRVPFAEENVAGVDLISEIKSGKRPDFTGSKEEPEWLKNQTRLCWESDAADRLPAASLKKHLEEYIEIQGRSTKELQEFISATVKKREKKSDLPQPTGNPPPQEPIREIPSFPPVQPPRHFSHRHAPNEPPQSPPRPLPDVPKSPPRALPDLPMQGNALEGMPPTAPKLPDRAPRGPPGLAAGGPMHMTDTTMQRFEAQDDSSEEDEPAGETVGVNNMTASQVREELTKFYQVHDPEMLNDLDELVVWCMTNSLEEFDKLLLERFGRGLPMFEVPAPMIEPPLPDRSEHKPRGGMGSIFGMGRKKKEDRPLPGIPDQDYGFDASSPPPFPARPKPPGL